jgi:hypothetical protein
MSVVRLAAAQASYVLTDRDAIIDKVGQLARVSAKQGASMLEAPASHGRRSDFRPP